MIRQVKGRAIWARMLIAAAVAGLVLVTGCSGTQTRSEDPAGSGMRERESQPLYYDFGDILIPRELNVVKESSFVFRTPGLSAGVLSLKGNVEVNSLIAFFETNMAKDNWTPMSSFKSPRSMMLFQKENRWCVINITDQSFSTYVEIWVAPTIGSAAAGTLGGPIEEGLLK
ncbi:MAG: hypothetical protein K9L59_19845 [Desulfobacterales bacterium]|nr:hypothetical protein [Desulfobacterales bacterium]MCF8080446.1 hypothetical protein [Desulfobacterales bacterium]